MINSFIKYTLCLCFVLLAYHNGIAQQRQQAIRGRILDLSTQAPIENVHIVNMQTYQGSTSNQDGFFTIQASVGDTIYVSALSYKTQNIVVAPSMSKREYSSFYLIPTSYQLNEMIVRSNYLTGILEVDVRSLDPVFVDRIVTMHGIKNSRQIDRRAAIASPLNPVEFISGFFSKEKKLKKLKEQTHLAELLSQRYDREFLRQSLGLTQEQLEELLVYCKQDPKWVLRASDLDILNALTKCQKDMEDKTKE